MKCHLCGEDREECGKCEHAEPGDFNCSAPFCMQFRCYIPAYKRCSQCLASEVKDNPNQQGENK